ncbi:MAG: hypothetical protein Q8N16_02380 [bacterium]|nr:hypothetical protein [bacterium]
MNRKTIVQTISREIGQTKQRLQELANDKRDGEGPRTSWHDQTHLDVERAIEDSQRHLARCLRVLASVQGHESSMVISDGSLVNLSIDGERGDYVIVEREDGGAIGNVLVLSSQSLIGGAIWNKPRGEHKVRTSSGLVRVKILEVS